jgi:hypothetical protein
MQIDDFKTKFNDVLRPNYYEVIIDPPTSLKQNSSFKIDNYDILPLLAVNVDFPFETIERIDHIIYSRKYKIANNIDFDPFNITFVLDSKGLILDFFNRWKDLIYDSDFKMNYYDEYIGKITIRMMDRMSQNIFEVNLIDAYPVNRNSIPLSYDTLDGRSEFIVAFDYLKPEYAHLGATYPEISNQAIKDTITKIYEKNYKTITFNPIVEIGTDVLDQIGSNAKRGVSEFITQGIRSIDLSGLNAKINVPVIGQINLQFGTMIENKVKELGRNVTDNITSAIETKVNKWQEQIKNKYKNLQSQAFNNIQRSIEKSVTRIFRF